MDRAKIVACLTTLLLSGCSRPGAIVVGSKNFTEQIILGEILAQHIERRLGVRVDRKFNLGGTLLAHEALTSGAIDLYPEYTGTALNAILKDRPAHDPVEVFRRVQSEYERRWGVTWLAPLGFDNTFAMTVRGEMARTARLATISDAARSRHAWKIGAGYEFTQRADGLSGLVETYGLRLLDSPVTMDLGLLYEALRNGQVDMVAANSTDGLLSVLDVTVLRDDKNFFPPYQCAVVAREDTLGAHPRLRHVLEELSGTISDEEMRRLNYAVDGKHRPPREVAAEFLTGLKDRQAAK